MTAFTDLRTAPDVLLSAVLALNAREEEATSPLDAARLARLVAAARHAVAVTGPEGVAAFLLGFGPGADYDSPNYRWIARHLSSFAYIDRVVVAPFARGRGLARALYADFAASCPDLGPLACEVNLVPPNPGSDAFHAALGFVEIGRDRPAPGKTVRYLMRPDPVRHPENGGAAAPMP